MFKLRDKKIVIGVIVSLVLFSSSLQAQDVYGAVNGDKITKQDVAIALKNPNVDFDSLPKKAKKQILDGIVERKLLAQKALKSGVQSDKDYKEALKKLKEDLALEIWMQKEYKKIKITQKEEKDYFNKNKTQFKVPATLEARHILVKTKKEAEDIIKALDKASNKKDEFIKLAKEKSTGPSASKGGYLGKFPETQMVPEFSKAAKVLNKGSYSKVPVKTQFGYHVIYLEDKQPSQNLAYDKVQKRIEQTLLQNKFKELIHSQTTELRKKAKIVIN